MKKKIKKTNSNKNGKATKNEKTADAAATDARAAEPERKGRPATVDYRKFVKLWRDAESVSAVATALGIQSTSATAIAAKLRKAGVTELKRFPRRGAQTIDVKLLNKIAVGKAD